MTILLAAALVVEGALWALDRRRLIKELARADEAIHARDRAAAIQMAEQAAILREYGDVVRDMHALAVQHADTELGLDIVRRYLEFTHQCNQPDRQEVNR